jgi:3-methyl-2-oxobutanoate hydroxymethyltransferase
VTGERRPPLHACLDRGAGSWANEGLLGYSRDHQPRHAKVYRNFRAEYERLQRERIAAFQEFRADVEKGAYPEDKHLVPIVDAEFEAFIGRL